jgi:hypothetical protein
LYTIRTKVWGEWDEEDRKEIETLAYFKWIDAGQPYNQDKYFWNIAEQEYRRNYFLNSDDDTIELTYFAPGKLRRGHTGYFYAPYVPLQ